MESRVEPVPVRSGRLPAGADQAPGGQPARRPCGPDRRHVREPVAAYQRWVSAEDRLAEFRRRRAGCAALGTHRLDRGEGAPPSRAVELAADSRIRTSSASIRAQAGGRTQPRPSAVAGDLIASLTAASPASVLVEDGCGSEQLFVVPGRCRRVAQDRERRAAARLGVDRFDVEHPARDRNRLEVAQHHLRVATALQGERLGDGRCPTRCRSAPGTATRRPSPTGSPAR